MPGFFAFSKTNNGHVTGRVLCLLTDKPNGANRQTGKGWGEMSLKLDETRVARELEHKEIDFPSPHARAE